MQSRFDCSSNAGLRYGAVLVATYDHHHLYHTSTGTVARIFSSRSVLPGSICSNLVCPSTFSKGWTLSLEAFLTVAMAYSTVLVQAKTLQLKSPNKTCVEGPTRRQQTVVYSNRRLGGSLSLDVSSEAQYSTKSYSTAQYSAVWYLKSKCSIVLVRYMGSRAIWRRFGAHYIQFMAAISTRTDRRSGDEIIAQEACARPRHCSLNRYE